MAAESEFWRRMALVYLASACVFAAVACIAALRSQMTLPFADDWRILDHYQSRSLARYLFGAENGHRLPVTLAILAIDHEWFGGRMRTLVLASIACTALATGLLWWTFREHAGLHRAAARSALAFACFALFWAVSCNDLLRGIYHMSLQTLALLVFALAALARVDPDRIPATRQWVWLAGVAAFFASWSHGAGVASWAALLAAAAVRRLPARLLAGLAAAAAATTALLAATLPPDPKNVFRDSIELLWQDPAGVAGTTLSFIGMAPARVASALGVGEPYPARFQPDRFAAHAQDLHRISVVFGLAGLLYAAYVAVQLARRPQRGTGLDALIAGLMAFALAAGFLVSFVRYPTEGATGVLHARFLLFSTLFWMASACTLVPRAAEGAAGARAWAALLALPIVSASMLPALRDARDFHAATRTQASKLGLSLLLGLRDDALARSVSLEDAETVYRVASRLEAAGRWPFEGPRSALRGSPLHERFASAAPCVGRLDRIYPIAGIGAAAVAGWLVRPPDRELPVFVVIADESGAIRGLADFASAPPYLAEGARSDALAWSGFVADYVASERYAAYAVLGTGPSACELRAP